MFQDASLIYEQKIIEIQSDIDKNRKTIDKIKGAMKKLSSGDKDGIDKLKVEFPVNPLPDDKF